ncbi:hypothetical protein PoB_003129600 [Plakobranchus ocellatus]|uniref:Uncharacterized protein n=1 Tax=Plakobranchus ocellatus TaxID=259542 RepID=A0AAV4A934_9GAST|nr:hypothetical protein PoB_003129600 [Plakobranchus ocellatus]
MQTVWSMFTLAKELLLRALWPPPARPLCPRPARTLAWTPGFPLSEELFAQQLHSNKAFCFSRSWPPIDFLIGMDGLNYKICQDYRLILSPSWDSSAPGLVIMSRLLSFA